MKTKKEIREQRDLIIEYLEHPHPEEWRLTSVLFTRKELESQVKAFNWVLGENRKIDKELLNQRAKNRFIEDMKNYGKWIER